jgi:molybdopterin molybdotransferase
MVTFELFVRPAMLKMGGHRLAHRRQLPATLMQDVGGSPGLTQFVRVRLDQGADGRWQATPTGAQGSGILTSMSRADGLLILSPETSGGRAGEIYPIIPFETAYLTHEFPGL